MDFAEILRRQYEFDSRHGWNPPPDDVNAVFRAIQDDLIGIMGEIGEFANVTKKLALEGERQGGPGLAAALTERSPDLSEELVDTFIYLIRLASHLKLDMEQAYLDKLLVNEKRFRSYEIPSD